MGRKKNNWKYLALALLLVLLFFLGTQGTWQPKDFDWGNIMNSSNWNFTVVPYPPLNETPPETPPTTPPTGDDGVGGPYGGWDSCSAWATALGKDHVSIGPTSMSECEEFAYYHCEAEGKTLMYFDWASPNCCIWKCTGTSTPTTCQTTCAGFHRYAGGSSDQASCNNIAIIGCAEHGVVNAFWKPTNCCCYDCSGDWG